MTKKLLFTIALSFSITSMLLITSCKKSQNKQTNTNSSSNSLLKNPKQGKPFTNGYISRFILVSQDNQVVLIGANNAAGSVFAIDLEDNDASQAGKNEITTDVTNLVPKFSALLGVNQNQIGIFNFEVNPISKSLYFLLFTSTSSNQSYLVKVTNAGNDVALVNLNNVKYSEIKFSSMGENVNDLSWGNKTLFVSYSHPTTLVGKIATIKGPLEHNAQMNSRATTVFKSNWGGSYFTNAPLETFCYAEVAGVRRLLGVTVCAPGFSIKADEINQSSDLLEVKEYYNLNTGIALKVFPVVSNGTTYLIEHHMNGRITRIGQKYLDESQTNVNQNAKVLLSNGGTTVASGLNDNDVKIVRASGIAAIAKLTETKALTITASGVLSSIAL